MAAAWIVPILFLLSGATALLYQVVWSRLLTLEMGHTAAAISTVLAAFMGGLAIGARLAGRYAPRTPQRRALAIYAGLELAIAGLALTLIPAQTFTRPWLAQAYADGDGGLSFALLRLSLSLAIVLLPAAAMGATLPFAVRFCEIDGRVAGRTAGRLYAMNTFGAALGAALSGFVLLPQFGLWQTTMIGVIVNVAIAVLCVLLWIGVKSPEPDIIEPPPPSFASTSFASTSSADRGSGGARRHARVDVTIEIGPTPRPQSAALAVALSGFAALVLEVAWTRVLVLTVGPTTYAFSMMVATFILGLAAGAALGTRLLRRINRPLDVLALVQVIVALTTFAAAYAAPRLPETVASLVASASHGFGSLLAIESLLIGAVLLPMAGALGAIFPLAVATAAPSRSDAAADVARIYTANTAGAIAGALAGGFFLVPHLGLRRTIILAGLVCVLSAVELVWRAPKRGRARVIVTSLAAVAAAIGIALPGWDEKLLSSGAYKYATDASDPRVSLDAGTLLYYGDGAAGTVSVRRIAGETSLAINGKVDASNAGDMLTQKLLAHLPLLLHPRPESVAIVGLGSGVTAGAALVHPVRRVETIELSPEVVVASSFFEKENRRALADPRSRVIVGDGRTHLRLSSRTYDVIVSEPSNPWMAGVASLFTREFFLSVRERLNQGGLFCQWAHTYDITREDFASIVATFRSVFPDAALWLVGEGDVLLIGGRDGAPDPTAIANRWTRPGVAEDLSLVAVRDPWSLLTLFAGAGHDLDALTRGALVQTDDRTALEFSAPLGLYGSRADRSWALQLAPARPVLALAHGDAISTGTMYANRAATLFRARAYHFAFDAAVHALDSQPADAETLSILARSALSIGRQAEALARLEAIVQRAPDLVLPRLELSRLQAILGLTDRAVATASEAAKQAPDHADALDQLASVLADAGNVDGLTAVVSEMQVRFPLRTETTYYEATLFFLQGKYHEAAKLGERLLKQRPTDPRVLNLAGAAYASLGVRDRAREAFEASIASDPRDPTSYVNLARFELETFNPRRAAALFTEALFLDPHSSAALNGLADAMSHLGQSDRAASLRARIPTT